MIPFQHTKPDFQNTWNQKKYGKFTKSWMWHDKNGEWLFYTVRYETSGGKNIIPFSYENNKWIAKQLINENRPLMDLHKIIKSEKDILLVEGEKCYDIAKKYLSNNFDVTTWVGGTGGISKTDWKPIENKAIYYWYDHDDPGYKTIEYLKTKLKKMILVCPQIDTPKGWDIADAVNIDRWTEDDLYLFIKGFNAIEKKLKDEFVDDINYPFEILGYNTGFMFFLPHETGQIYQIRKGSLSAAHLIELAPLEFWEKYYGTENTRGVTIAWMNATDNVIRSCNSKNPFSYNNIRGRGAWKENDNIIIHTGKHLLIDENIIDVVDYSPNGHVYERLPELKLNIIKNKLTDTELEKVIACFRKLSIISKLELNYLVGWCVLAPFCGAMEWRPHIWITGPAGSGKSAIVHMIIHQMLGEFIFCPEGDSSGAGIIQGLKNDSLPVVHDEIDREAAAMGKLETELSITRSSSSASEKTSLYKGTADQTGKIYNYNSMFCFSSINLYLNKKSDKSRFSIINLSKNLLIPWKHFKKEIQETFSKKICGKIRSEIFYNWNIIKNNIDMFKSVSGEYLKDQRTGDQIGTLLAGAKSLLKLKNHTEKEVTEICIKNLKNYISEDDCLTDEIECLTKIFTAKIKYINYDNKIEETTLLSLTNRAVGNIAENTPDPRARKELYKYGINYDDKKNKIYIAMNYEWIKNILTNTPWRYNYSTILKRLSFVDNTSSVCYFGTYYTGRALEMDADYILRLSDDAVYMEAGF